MNRYRLFAMFAVVGTTTAAAAAIAATASPASADVVGQSAVSANWAGYVAGGTQFSSVSGSWVQPTAKCGSGQTYSAFWVGLGGSGNSSSSSSSSSLEQTGTQADCNADGSTNYYAWYELVPAAPVQLDLSINPGDHIAAKVDVSGTDVTVALTNQTTGQSATKTLQMSNPDPDTSSAEWIAEAPSSCDGSGSCQPLPLADFGSVQFTSATATANGHTGSISDSNWSAQPVSLGSSGASDVSFSSSGSGSAGASPSSLSTDGSTFSVAYQGDGSGTAGAAGGSGDYGYGGGGYGYGGYPGGDGSYGYGGYPGGYGPYGYGDGGYGGGGYGYGVF